MAIETSERVLNDARVTEVLRRLHRQSGRETIRLAGGLATQVGRWLARRPMRWERLASKLAPPSLGVNPSSGLFAYLIARAIGARTVVEYGSSYGTSAIYPACAVRDNGGGRVIGSELVESKARAAQAAAEDAGLAGIVEIRVGDASSPLPSRGRCGVAPLRKARSEVRRSPNGGAMDPLTLFSGRP